MPEEVHPTDQEPPASIQHIITSISPRRRRDREGDSPKPHSANNGNGQNPGHITTTTNPYPQHTSNVSYPANQSAPVMNFLRPTAQSSQNPVIQTYIRTSCDWCADEDQIPKYNTGRSWKQHGFIWYVVLLLFTLLFGLAILCPFHSPSLHKIQCANVFFQVRALR
jgi:hypothetical protein